MLCIISLDKSRVRCARVGNARAGSPANHFVCRNRRLTTTQLSYNACVPLFVLQRRFGNHLLDSRHIIVRDKTQLRKWYITFHTFIADKRDWSAMYRIGVSVHFVFLRCKLPINYAATGRRNQVPASKIAIFLSYFCGDFCLLSTR